MSASRLPPPATAGNVNAANPIFSTRQLVAESAKSFLDNVFKPPATDTTSDLPSTPSKAQCTDDGCDWPVFEISEREVLEQVNMHKRFQLPSIEGVEITDLPPFDDFSLYGEVGEQAQQDVWAKEVSRLVTAIKEDEVPLFHGSQDLAFDSNKAHEILISLADRFILAVSVLSYDGECLLAEHQPGACNIDVLERSLITLGYVCNKDEADKADLDNEPATKLEDLFAFINYCTAILARITYAETSDRLVANRLLSHIAKISAKVKVVSANIEACCRISIDNGIRDEELASLRLGEEKGRRSGLPAAQNAMSGTAEGQQASQPNIAGWPANVAAAPGRGGIPTFSGDPMDGRESVSKTGAVRRLYFSQCAPARFGLLELLLCLMVRLRGASRLTRVSYASYEITAMVYETGLERFRTLVFQDQNNNFGGSARPALVDTSRHAFRQLNSTAQHIRDCQNERDRRALGVGYDSMSLGVRLTWTYVIEDGMNSDRAPIDSYAQTNLELSSMHNVVSVIVPLFFTGPDMVRLVYGLFGSLSETSLHLWANERTNEARARTRVSRRFTASFCLDTKQHREAQQELGPDESKSLSNSLVSRNGLLGGKRIAEIGRARSFGATLTKPTNPQERYRVADGDRTYLSQIKKNLAELENASRVMKTWVLEEKGVMVQCKLYIFLVMALCTILVLGGITIGITLGERINGVDPFNITTYCWVLAAFLVLVAKSVRVHDWPWNDFLHGRVLCKSVSELSSVTGIHPQCIIAYLLQTEAKSFLETRGPFHIAFKRKADDGFSVDIPLSTWTILLSGLIMIEVETLSGRRGLVCLDLRRGTRHYEVRDRSSSSMGSPNHRELCCSDLQDQILDENTKQPRARLTYASGITWVRVIGFYGNRNTVYV